TGGQALPDSQAKPDLQQAFNAIKYRELLDRLEISIIRKSEVFTPFFNERCDSEFFQKFYDNLYKNILSKDYNFLGDIAFITDGEHGNAKTSETGYSKYYGARNVLSGILNDNNVEYITKEHHEKLKKSSLKPRDVLISCVGANIGYAAIVPDDIGIANIVRNVVLIRSANDNFINEYIHIYLCSNYGKNLYIRMNTGNAQPLVSLDYIKTIPVFRASINFQVEIRRITTLSLNTLEQSKSTYTQAENLLLNALGMADFSPSTENVNIKSFKDSFLATGRLDAEYYQPKYEEVMTQIKQLPCDRLSEFIENYSTGYPYKSDDYLEYSGIPLIRINNIKKGFLDITNTAYLPVEQIALSENDVAVENDILLSMSGTIGNACVIPKGVTALINQRIMRFTPKNYNPLALMLILNSIVGEYQLERIGTGGVQTNISSNDINKIIIPILPDETQTKIADLVQQSFQLKAQSEQLLSVAKRAVEIAIEENETAAINYIK
ncbi:MAG: restriction endonuclease subunit S, partial [Methylococcaceae bacterium]